MKTLLIILCSLIISSFTFAQEPDLKTLAQQQANVTLTIYKVKGQIELNNFLVIQSGRRAARLEDKLKQLNTQLAEIQATIKKLDAKKK